jgi:replicative DNA helicase
VNDRLPPHDIDAEEAVIGSLLIDGAAIHKIATFLNPQDFYYEQNHWLYGACSELYRRSDAINQITVAQELARQGKLEMVGGAAHLSYLIANCPTSLDIEHYAQIVYRLSVSRQLIGAGDRIAAIGYEAGPDADAGLSRAEDVLFRLRRGQGLRDFTHIRSVLDQYFEETEPEEGQERELIPYVFSGFTSLDEFLSGFQRSDLIIIAGRPSMGKTSFALNIARNAAVKQGACVALFSLEMSRESVVMRLLANESSVNSRRVRLGHHSEEEEQRIMDAIGVLSESQIYLDDSPQAKVAEMRSKALRLNFEHPIDLVVVDYLQLIQEENRRESRVLELGYITRSLKGLARELNVPVIVASQLSRAVEWRASHVPQLSDLRESGSIEQDADIVIFLYRDEYYYTEEEWRELHPDQEYPREATDVIIAKHRNGPTGQIKLRFTHSLARFENFAAERIAGEPNLL